MQSMCRLWRGLGILSLGVMLIACSENGTSPHTENLGACKVQLFDGKNFSNGSLLIMGPAQYGSLSHLPGAGGENWNHKATSLRVGQHTQLKVWTEKNFQGVETLYITGNYDSIAAPASLKIICQNPGGVN